MRDINLIPPDILSARRISRRLRLWIALNLGVAGILVLGIAAALWSVRAERATAWQLDERMVELRSRTEELDRLRAEKTLLDKEERALACFVGRTPDHHLIRALAESIADKGWLSRIEITRAIGGPGREGDFGFLKMEGHAGSYRHLAELMQRLDSLDWISGVDLKRSQSAEADGLAVIAFELECAVSPQGAERR